MKCPCKTCITFPICKNKYVTYIYSENGYIIDKILSIKLFKCPYIKDYYSESTNVKTSINKDIELHKIYNIPYPGQYVIKKRKSMG